MALYTYAQEKWPILIYYSLYAEQHRLWKNAVHVPDVDSQTFDINSLNISQTYAYRRRRTKINTARLQAA